MGSAGCRYIDPIADRPLGVDTGWQRNNGVVRSRKRQRAANLARNPLRFALETKAFGRRMTRILGVLVIWNAYHAWRLMQLRSASVGKAYLKGVIDAARGHMGAYSKPAS